MDSKIKAREIKRIKDAQKNNKVYISSEIISPNRINELFLKALKDVLNEDNNNINLNDKGGLNDE